MKLKAILPLLNVAVMAWFAPALSGAPAQNTSALSQTVVSAWPQPYTVQHNRHEGTLTLAVPYYTIQYDLKRGGAISAIHLTHGQAANLLVAPLETRVKDAAGQVYSDLADNAPRVTSGKVGSNQVVTVESKLMGTHGESSGIRVKTVYTCRWGYLKIHRELSFDDRHFTALEICPVSTVVAPSLATFGYRDGLNEPEGAGAFPFGSCHWGQVKAAAGEPALATSDAPHYMMLADPGVEGIEWFASDDLAQWEMPLDGKRRQGKTVLQRSENPAGIHFSVSPYQNAQTAIAVPPRLAFDFYIGLPLLEGHAFKPWFNASFNRNHGDWVSTNQIQEWVASGIQTVHCHNDGDYYGDGLFWRDGSYPPYPDMDKYDTVITNCHAAGIRTATYFSNKELHPSTSEFQQHGTEWGRMNQKHQLEHNAFNDKAEFGAQMCLRSGWLAYLETCVDRVLTHNPLDGVYYDWNVALRCSNPSHEGLATNAVAADHWDIDELLALMEWTRYRVGPQGLVIIHNTSTPMFATENFADHVVAYEWGYPHWSGAGPTPSELPLEWSLVNSRPRGVISYGMVGTGTPHLHRLFALEALLSGVAPWPASSEAETLYPILNPIGKIEDCRFADWRNQAVTLQAQRFNSAIFSRPNESWILAGNLDDSAREVSCVIHPDKLPYPLAAVTSATLVTSNQSETNTVTLDARQLTENGVTLKVPAESAVLLHVQ